MTNTLFPRSAVYALGIALKSPSADLPDAVVAFAEACMAHERAACARIARRPVADATNPDDYERACLEIETKILARGTK